MLDRRDQPPRPGTAVGGIKEKVVAASAGIKRVMLPARNRWDFDDIPEQARAV
jgi:ATP-dependent Lon protease